MRWLVPPLLFLASCGTAPDDFTVECGNFTPVAVHNTSWQHLGPDDVERIDLYECPPEKDQVCSEPLPSDSLHVNANVDVQRGQIFVSCFSIEDGARVRVVVHWR